jgi:hypothetical protein
MSLVPLAPLEMPDPLQLRRARHKRCCIGSHASLLVDTPEMLHTGPAAAEWAPRSSVEVLDVGFLELSVSPPETMKCACLGISADVAGSHQQALTLAVVENIAVLPVLFLTARPFCLRLFGSVPAACMYANSGCF